MGQQITKIETPQSLAITDEFPVGKRFETPDGWVVVVESSPDYVYVCGEKTVMLRRVKLGGAKKRVAESASILIESEHSSSKWSRSGKKKKQSSADGSPPDKFITENLG